MVLVPVLWRKQRHLLMDLTTEPLYQSDPSGRRSYYKVRSTREGQNNENRWGCNQTRAECEERSKNVWAKVVQVNKARKPWNPSHRIFNTTQKTKFCEIKQTKTLPQTLFILKVQEIFTLKWAKEKYQSQNKQNYLKKQGSESTSLSLSLSLSLTHTHTHTHFRLWLMPRSEIPSPLH